MTSMSVLTLNAERAKIAKSLWLCGLRGLCVLRPLIGHVRHERDLPGALDRRLQFALMHRARARDAAWQNLAPLRDERTNQLDVLVVDIVDLVRAELADLPASEECAALSLFLVPRLLVAPAASTAAAARASVSEWHLNLHSVETIVIRIVRLARGTALARLPLWRQPALHAAPLGRGPAPGLRALDDLLLFVDAHDHVPNHLVHHLQPAIQLLHQLARPLDHLEDVH